MPPVLPLIGADLKAYNNVATTPPKNPLGDIINALYWSSGGMAINSPVVGGVPGSVLYIGPGGALQQVPNGVGVLANDGAGNLYWAPSGASGLYNCDASISVRDAVYLSASGTCAAADADDATKQPLIGIVASKPTATTAVMQYHGEVGGFVGLTPGATYYLSKTPGQITAVAPSDPGDIIQRVGFAKTPNVLVLMVDRDYVVLT